LLRQDPDGQGATANAVKVVMANTLRRVVVAA